MNHRGQRAGNGLIPVEIVLERRGQVESIIQWRLIQQPPVVDKIAHEQLLVGVEAMVYAQESVVGVIRTEDAAKIWLGRKIKVSLERVNGSDVGKHRGVIKRRFPAPPQLVIRVRKSLDLLNRPANRP